MKILMVTSETVPFSKSGGLADVVGALSPALNAMGNDARIVVPLYNSDASQGGESVCVLYIPMLARIHKVEVRLKIVSGTYYYFLCNPMYCDRKGIYGDTSFEPYADNLIRFSVLDKAALELCRRLDWRPDIIHCHDWTAGFLPYFIKQQNDSFFRKTKTVFTIHNLAYQGTFARMDFLYTEVTPDSLLFSGSQVNMMKSAIAFSDYITTVSPSYAQEIKTPQQGCGLENLLMSKSECLCGIVNGIDTDEWNPETDRFIETPFSTDDMSGKALVKETIQKTFGLPMAPDVPIFAMISRLASQKGFDVLLECLEGILNSYRLQFVIIGTGDSRLEKGLLDIASRCDNISVNILFSAKLAHIVEAGSDFFLMPSRYEPCGLNQLYSLRYGTIPVARRTGGLADTISDLGENPDSGTGFLFDELLPIEITNSIERAVSLYGSSSFGDVRLRAMKKDYSWSASARKYLEVYRHLNEMSAMSV